MQRLHDLTVLLRDFYFHYELLALFLILVVEEAGVPLVPPGYLLMIYAGTKSGRPLPSALLVVAVASLAVFAGSYFTFYLLRRFGRERLLKSSRFFRVKQSRIERMERWMERYGRAGVFAGRLIPGLRVPTIFVAGLAGMHFATFAIIDAITAVIWAAGYFWLGVPISRFTHTAYHVAANAMHNPWRVAFVASVSLAVVIGIWYWVKRQRASVDSVQTRRDPLRSAVAPDRDATGV